MLLRTSRGLKIGPWLPGGRPRTAFGRQSVLQKGSHLTFWCNFLFHYGCFGVFQDHFPITLSWFLPLFHFLMFIYGFPVDSHLHGGRKPLAFIIYMVCISHVYGVYVMHMMCLWYA